MPATLLKDEALPEARGGARALDWATPPDIDATASRPAASRERLRLRLYMALGLVDAASVFLAFVIASRLWEGTVFPSRGIDMFIVLLPIFMGVSVNSRAYSIDVLKTPKLGVQRVIRSFVFALAAVIGTVFYLKVSAEFSRMATAIATVLSLLFLGGGRWLFGHFIGNRIGWRFTNELVIVDGAPVPPLSGQAVLFADQAKFSPSTDDPASLDRIGRLIENCDRVVLACSPERRTAWSAMLKGADMDVEVLSPELDGLGALDMGRFEGSSTVLINRGPLPLRERTMKRVFDLVVAVPALILTAPVLLIIALAIKLESRGPVFFRQRRIGLCNRMFRIFKFRTMRVEGADESGRKVTQINDDRVTRVGAFLRKTSLDELPQLINVVLGEMSIVGPRPHPTGALAGESLFWEVDARYWNRHAVKPGITGLAQVRGFRGTTYHHEDLSNRLQADLEYLTGWSIWRDIGIVAATFRVMTHRNAY